jgi:hypothetical protein
MASNALASIAAATAAGYVLERVTGSDGKNRTRLKKQVSGQPGVGGSSLTWEGEAASSGAADTAALANLNSWRSNRYGADSAQASLSTVPDASATPSSQTSAPTHQSLTKDRH